MTNVLSRDNVYFFLQKIRTYLRTYNQIWVNYHLCKNPFRLTLENAGSYSQVFNVLHKFRAVET